MLKYFDYLFEMAFISLLIRTLIVGAGVGEAIGLVAVVAAIAYSKFLTKEKVDNTSEINKRLDEMSTQLQSLQMDKVMRKANTNEQKAQTTTPSKYRF